ncbi:YjgF/Yer057p/UK114 family [Penicillium concentricum]|uniref:YjgF/Yer057p/UK114 family n=1 Tax=Penicillium concentricum TaxID=293559 RepID=A0A9W9VBT3_9EURO|nr:YjgF/Yer057p/UK114 family [Penicillium concentricum]KAJ5373765.1 YjgF/Yer057p/UK114 family [Penicillium concentricum]
MSKPTRTAVSTKGAPLPPPILSQGLVVGNVVYCSGQLGVDPITGEMVEGTIQDRTRQILRNLNAVLEAGGSSLHDAIKVNIFLTDMADFSAVNEVYSTFFSDPKPVRTCIAVKSLPKGSDVEIECSGLVTKPSNGRSSRL